MPEIKDRGEGNAKRKERLAKQKKGSGTFVYNGEAVDTEWIPTIKLMGRQVPELNDAGMPVLDGSGRQMFKPAGTPVYDDKGQPMFGGPPKVVTHKIEVFKLRKMEFPAGKPVFVGDSALALKLRCMGCFEEVEHIDEAAKDSPAEAPKKRGRPRKDEAGAEE